jgi:regulator of protease activity HflC (stomatin/prohibitin superfamily)
MAAGAVPLIVVVFFALFILMNAIRILQEYERGVIFRLGRMIGVKGPGLILLIPLVDRMVKVSLRTFTMDVPPQDVITKDNVTVKVNAVIYFMVMEPAKAIINVEDYFYATSMISQTTLRSVLGQVDLDDLLSNREEINQRLQKIIDDQTEPWGVKVSVVEVKNVDLPQEMIRAISQQAEAERTRRAKVIHATGEFQAATKLTEAAKVMEQSQYTLQLRFLQTLTEVAAEKNSTLVFPVPIDLLTPFMRKMQLESDQLEKKE